MPYEVFDRVATVAEHRQLAGLVGWEDSFRWEAMPSSLAGSSCGTVILDEAGAIVAMGRVVGDGAFFFYVQDVAVHSGHRARGLGAVVVERLRAQVTELAGGTAFLGLFSTPEAEPLYERTGFRGPAGPDRNVADPAGRARGRIGAGMTRDLLVERPCFRTRPPRPAR